MIMPISAVPTQARPNFRGAISAAEPFDEAISKFTVMEKNRWREVKKLAENSNDGLLFQIYQNIEKIGKTIIKSVVVKNNKDGVLSEEVYNITKGGSVLLFNRELVARTILDTLEGIYKK